jgi:hypothetical protein
MFSHAFSEFACVHGPDGVPLVDPGWRPPALDFAVVAAFAPPGRGPDEDFRNSRYADHFRRGRVEATYYVPRIEALEKTLASPALPTAWRPAPPERREDGSRCLCSSSTVMCDCSRPSNIAALGQAARF